jgi:hypothetical protein
MLETAINIHFFRLFYLRARLYSRQEGQVSFAHVWDFRTVGKARPG